MDAKVKSEGCRMTEGYSLKQSQEYLPHSRTHIWGNWDPAEGMRFIYAMLGIPHTIIVNNNVR